MTAKSFVKNYADNGKTSLVSRKHKHCKTFGYNVIAFVLKHVRKISAFLKLRGSRKTLKLKYEAMESTKTGLKYYVRKSR